MRKFILPVLGLATSIVGVVLAFGSCNRAGEVVIPWMMQWATLLTIIGIFGVFLGLMVVDDHQRLQREKERRRRARVQWQRYFEDTFHVR